MRWCQFLVWVRLCLLACSVVCLYLCMPRCSHSISPALCNWGSSLAWYLYLSWSFFNAENLWVHLLFPFMCKQVQRKPRYTIGIQLMNESSDVHACGYSYVCLFIYCLLYAQQGAQVHRLPCLARAPKQSCRQIYFSGIPLDFRSAISTIRQMRRVRVLVRAWYGGTLIEVKRVSTCLSRDCHILFSVRL